MPVKFNYDPDRQLINVHPAGVLSISDIAEYMEAVLNDRAIGNGFVELVHLEQVDNFRFDYIKAMELTGLYEKMSKEKQIKGTVLLAPKDYQYGIARMCSLILEDHLEVRVVRSQKEAEKEINALMYKG